MCCTRLCLFLYPLLFYRAAASFQGKPCAFVDVNYDQMTDVVAIFNSKTIIAYTQSVESTVIETTQPSKFTPDDRFRVNIPDGEIVDCHLADFDSDTAIDILLVVKKDDEHQLRLYWGARNDSGFVKSDETFSLSGVVNNVMIINHGSKLLSEILIQNAANFTLSILKCADFENQTILIESNVFDGFIAEPSFMHAYADLIKNEKLKTTDSDLIADLLFGANCTHSNNYATGLCHLVIFQLDTDGTWQRALTIKPPSMQQKANSVLFPSSATVERAGDLTLSDFDADGYYDILQPLCGTANCIESVLTLAITTRQNDTNMFNWTTMQINLLDSSNAKQKISFRPVISDETKSFQLRVGDYTRTGYPDLLILLENTGDPNDRRSVLLENKPCVEDNCVYSRMFIPQFKQPMMVVKPNSKISNVAFFDVEENGVLDILYEYKDLNGDYFDFVYTKNLEDSTFLKAEVYTASCTIPCGFNRREGSVVVMPGATLKYESVDEKYNSIEGIHTQLSQCGRRALTLPFAIFGLGRSPNFVERLTAATPSLYHGVNSHQWEQIIPNSRAFIIPSIDSTWILRLYLTPSRLVLLSFLAMVILGALSLAVIVILWCRERKQDERERMLQAHKFDFNAM